MAKVAETLVDITGKADFEAIRDLIEKEGLKYTQGQIKGLLRGREIQKQADLFKFAKEHPESCPPVGASLIYTSEYGVKLKVTVTMVFRGLPGTTDELLPLAEQPEHLQGNPELLASHTVGIRRKGWTSHADVVFYKDWQRHKGVNINGK